MPGEEKIGVPRVVRKRKSRGKKASGSAHRAHVPIRGSDKPREPPVTAEGIRGHLHARGAPCATTILGFHDCFRTVFF